ncbi:S1 family peptidase [Acidihalobacter prosperus]|uniref:Trypsin-like serine protease n=1 Tax=Acidihalobacter prosperus TaxID=160660 RepID=A0A1A6C0K1_9GAMM|nr:serine protease [Acidihalobacter prosperus]OBS08086.1 trypsin-like serine protease [Acidihalobacter prosperus]
MRIDTLAKRLMFNTVRVDTVLEDGTEGSGTGFVVAHQGPHGLRRFIVTNRHLVEGVRSGGLVFTQGRDGQPLIGTRFELEIEEFPHAWFLHPDPEMDLAIVPMAPLERAARDQGVQLYYHDIDTALVPDAATVNGFDALEEILFVGYPNGVWDHVNLLPIMRRGTTATPIGMDFEGQAEFLIDAAVYPGSSGSPVFLYRGEGTAQAGAARAPLYFLGVIAAVFFREEENQLVPGPVPASQGGATVRQSEMIDLGLVIKSQAVVGLIEEYCRRWRE